MESKPNLAIGEVVLFPIEDGSYLRGTILSFLRSDKKARIEEEITGDIYKCPTVSLDKIVSNDVNWRFKYYEDLATLTIFKELKSIFVAGEGGLGKSYIIQQILESEEFREDRDYVYVKGHVSAYALFQLLQDHPSKPFIFDDCDGILKDPIALNILKGVIDSYSVRKVKWLTNSGVASRVSRTFEFTGSIIFLSNLNVENVPQPIVSRTTMVDVSMTSKEKMERMRHIVKHMPEMEAISLVDREKLLDILDSYKMIVKDFNLRSLVKAANMFNKTGDWSYVKASILAS
jgi:hypothetical protein